MPNQWRRHGPGDSAAGASVVIASGIRASALGHLTVRSARGLTLLAALAWPLAGHPADAPTAAENPVLEARMMVLAAELRCLVCQNQTIADSHADLAVDLRQQIREQLTQGRSEDQIRDYMTARYGDFVLYKPPFKATTALLWVGPPLLLLGALAGLFLMLRARQRASPDAFDPEMPDELAHEPADGTDARPPR